MYLDSYSGCGKKDVGERGRGGREDVKQQCERVR